MEEYIIKFAKHQKLPEGYRVEFWTCDERYHWVIDENIYSCAFSTRWQAYRSAWFNYNSKNISIIN